MASFFYRPSTGFPPPPTIVTHDEKGEDAMSEPGSRPRSRQTLFVLATVAALALVAGGPLKPPPAPGPPVEVFY